MVSEMKFDRVRRILQTIFEEMMSDYEEKRKGNIRQFTFCNRCKYVHEYRIDEKMVFLRCKSCLHVHSKRDMSAREHTDILQYELQQPTQTEPVRQGATQVGKKLSEEERTFYIQHCIKASPFYREGNLIDYECLDDSKLIKVYEYYKSKRLEYIEYCEDMTQYYRPDKNVQFHLLGDEDLVSYVEMYKYDQATPSVLDEVCDGKG